MGRILRSGGRRRALLVLVLLVTLTLSGCILLKPPFTPAHVEPRHRPRTPHSARRRRRSSCPSPTSRLARDHRLVMGLPAARPPGVVRVVGGGDSG
jgi:hypothetical protein